MFSCFGAFAQSATSGQPPKKKQRVSAEEQAHVIEGTAEQPAAEGAVVDPEGEGRADTGVAVADVTGEPAVEGSGYAEVEVNHVEGEPAKEGSSDDKAPVGESGAGEDDVASPSLEPGFSLTAMKSLTGERKQIEGLQPNTLVAELMQRVRDAFGYSDCRHTFNSVGKFCIDKEPLTELSRTLEELNISSSTVVDFVLTESLMTLKLPDGNLRVIPDIALKCAKIKAAADEQGSNEEVELSDPACKIQPLTHALEYLAYHRHHPECESDIQKPLRSTDLIACGASAWDADFVNMPQEELFEVILTANHFDLKDLLDLSCAKVASMIKGKTTEEIRKTFNIVNDFTPEEEAQVREENRWCEDP